MCDKEMDQLLISPRLCHRALDVSMFSLPLSIETDITDTETERSTLPKAAFVITEKTVTLLIVSTGFNIIRHAHSNHIGGSSFRMLGDVNGIVVSYAEGK